MTEKQYIKIATIDWDGGVHYVYELAGNSLEFIARQSTINTAFVVVANEGKFFLIRPAAFYSLHLDIIRGEFPDEDSAIVAAQMMLASHHE